jgi:hypothetical protein
MKLPMRPAARPVGTQGATTSITSRKRRWRDACKQGHGHDHAQQAAVKGHAALPHHQDLGRVGQVLSGLVEQRVAQAPAHDHAEHAVEEQVLHVAARPAGVGNAAGFARAPASQQEQAEGGQVGQAVPVDLHRPEASATGSNWGCTSMGGS